MPAESDPTERELAERDRYRAAAHDLRRRADRAEAEGDARARDLYLVEAARLYRAAGRTGLAGYCERRVGRPLRPRVEYPAEGRDEREPAEG